MLAEMALVLAAVGVPALIAYVTTPRTDSRRMPQPRKR